MLNVIIELLKTIALIVITEKDIASQLTREIINLNIIRFNGQTPYLKLKTHWQKLNHLDFLTLIRNLINSSDRHKVQSKHISEVAKRLSEDINLKFDVESAYQTQQYLINFKNGVYDIKAGKFSEDREKWVFDYVIDVNFNAAFTEKDCPNFMNFIETSVGIENKDCIMISSGYAISSLTDVKKSIFLTGETDGGKSTYLRMLESAVAPELVSNVSFQQLGDRYYIIRLQGKKLNIAYDNSPKPLDNEEVFKSVVSCERIEGRALRENPVQFIPVAKLFFASNKPYVFKHPDLALYRRMVIIPFEYSIPPEKQDKDLFNKLMIERDAIFSLAAKSLKEFVASGYDFKMSAKGKAYLENRITALHSVEGFLSDRAVIDNKGYVSAASLFDYYKQWCAENALDPEEKSTFKESVLGFEPTITYAKVGPAQKRLWGFKGIRLRSSDEFNTKDMKQGD